jgi:hypothetical protein
MAVSKKEIWNRMADHARWMNDWEEFGIREKVRGVGELIDGRWIPGKRMDEGGDR